MLQLKDLREHGMSVKNTPYQNTESFYVNKRQENSQINTLIVFLLVLNQMDL